MFSKCNLSVCIGCSVCGTCVCSYIYVIQSYVIMSASVLGFYRIPSFPPPLCVCVYMHACVRACMCVCTAHTAVWLAVEVPFAEMINYYYY